MAIPQRKSTGFENLTAANDDLAHPGNNPRIPDIRVNIRDVFGIAAHNPTSLAYSERTALVPEIDPTYHFDPEVTESILAGFNDNRRVLIHGFHGTGKTSHIEQVAARLNWPVLRINLDGQISRNDLLGKEGIVIRDGKQVTEFKEGLLPWAMRNDVALIFDEYDAGRPDVMFVVQRVLENDGKLTLLDNNDVLSGGPGFRIFGTANTNGLGDTTGLYHGTQQINRAQMDRWHIKERLDYLPPAVEEQIVLAKEPWLDARIAKSMVAIANLTRQGFAQNDLSTMMSPRTVFNWAANARIFGDVDRAFKKTFSNDIDETERPLLVEYYQRAFGREIVFKPVIEPGSLRL